MDKRDDIPLQDGGGVALDEEPQTRQEVDEAEERGE
jgi:hypothetical protein